MAAMSAFSLSGHTLALFTLEVVFWLCEVLVTAGSHVTVDSRGYILYCPCNGRFGNQADTFLGMLSFSKGLNRTLVLPHWVEFRSEHGNSTQVAFDKYFKVKPLQDSHRVITMKTFMKHLAPTIWPPSARRVTCYGPRAGPKRSDCNAKYGSPSGPFWDTFNIDFVGSQFYNSIITSLSDYDLTNAIVASKWTNRFPPGHYPVVAFIGAPVFMPVIAMNIPLHKYLVWSDSVQSQAEGFVRTNIPSKPFLGIHLRHARDWAYACHHHLFWKPGRNLFSSSQCLGDNYEYGVFTLDMCLPPDDLIMTQVKRTLMEMKATSLFVAADDRPMIAELTQYLKMKVSVVRLDTPSAHVDLAILAMADQYIGNCASTFSSFAARERRMHNKPVSFWAFDKTVKHNEL